jgi:ubiquinone biosynthesis protein UbiJ
MVFDWVLSPYSQQRNFFLLGIVLTVRFWKVSWIFFLVDGLKDFLTFYEEAVDCLLATDSVPVS